MFPEPKASAPRKCCGSEVRIDRCKQGQGCDRNREDNVPSSPPRTRPPRRSNTASKRWTALTRFLDDARLCCRTTPPKALRAIAVGRHNWTFPGFDEGVRRAAAIYTLIETAKLNDIDPQAWLAYVLARLQDHPAKRLDELLPWNWRTDYIRLAL
jgi:IS66 C-terminal element